MITALTTQNTFMPKFRGDSEHVHGPNCKHDHDHSGHDHNHEHSDQVTLPTSGKVHSHEGHDHAGHDHEHHDHDHKHHHHPKPGYRYKNPVIRAIVNFFGWFYELGKSFVYDITGKKADDEHAGHSH